MQGFFASIHWPTVVVTIVILLLLGMLFGRRR